MEWLFPSAFKISLFPAKSTGNLEQLSQDQQPEESVREVVEEEEEQTLIEIPSADDATDGGGAVGPAPSCSGRHQMRRRSSLSDLDVLKEKRSELQRMTRGNERLSIVGEDTGSRRHARVYPLLLDGSGGGHLQQQHSVTDYPLSHSGSRGGSIGDMINLKLYGSNRSLVSMTSSIAEAVPLETVSCCGRRKATHTTSSSSIQRPEQPDLAEEEDPIVPIICPDDDVIIVEEEAEEAYDTFGLDSKSRTLSIPERALRLSQLIQNRQCRCSRYEEEVAVMRHIRHYIDLSVLFFPFLPTRF